MEQPDVEKSCPGADDVGLTRNRSFKSKQLVRSQAIRESTSPPRTASPYTASPASDGGVATPVDAIASNNSDRTENVSDTSSHSDKCSVINSDRKCDDDRKKPVEIQITSGAWEEAHSDQRLRTRRWLGHRHHSDSSRDLLSYNPRVTCVCGSCACSQCRGQRTKQICPTKQDSGIVCSEDCPDCTDCSGHAGQNGGETKGSGSFDAEEQGFYCRCTERKEKPKSFSLSRTDSEDRLDPTGPELVNFIKETLNKNPRDRMTLLRIEKELHSLITDNGRCIVRFPVMTSYGRMLVHRCASLFQLAHHLDHPNKNCVLVSKSGTSGGRIPCTSFRQWCTAVFPKSPPRRHDDTTLAKSILKREGPGSVGNGAGAAPRSKSLEQRERDYERVRRRIFSSDNCAQDETQWPWMNSGPVKVLTPEAGRNKLLKVQSLEARGSAAPAATPAARGPVSKSHSFGGYTGEPPQHRLLSRQGDLASSSWRLSPSSSGYKTLSLRSTDSVTPSPTGGASPEPHAEGGALVWAVTDLAVVPAGAVVIHPQTGRALTNADGSLYHFDPHNPPVLYDAAACAALQDDLKMDAGSDKRRGKLEKQHSFIDNECECAADECRGKCCCECRRREPSHRPADQTNKEIQTVTIPNSPIKTEYTEPSTAEPQAADQPYEDQRPEPDYETAGQSYEPKYEPPKDQRDSQRQYDIQNSNSPKNFEPANQRVVYDTANQRSYEAANHRASYENQRSFDSTQQYDRSKVSRNSTMLQNQEYQEVQPCYVQGIRNEEIVSPLGAQQYGVVDDAGVLVAKTTPVTVADPNIRPVSLTNMSYPLLQQPTYPYVNPCRVDPQMQAVYHMQADEQKTAHDNTFRIDPSYPYAADFSTACGACDPTQQQQQRQYSLQYGQLEVPQVMPQYTLPVSNMLVQQPLQYQQYQEPIHWQSLPQPPPLAGQLAPKLMLHDVYPVVYPNVYQPYNIVYPQVIPQPYPICQPMYPVMDKPQEFQRRATFNPKRNSLPNSSRNTPQAPSDDKRCEDRKREDMKRQTSSEIAVTIQQIKEQMEQVSTRDRGGRRDDWRRRNSGTGLLGSYPAGAVNGRPLGRPADDAHISSAARAIVNSIRTIQARNSDQDRRFNEQREQYRRPRQDSRPEQTAQPPGASGPPADRRDTRRNYNPLLNYRPPYLFRQMSPNTWCRRSPGPVAPVLNQPRRPHPDSRNGRR